MHNLYLFYSVFLRRFFKKLYHPPYGFFLRTHLIKKLEFSIPVNVDNRLYF
ncbi:Uncharacterised protein [Mycobacteroides abscessus subsp. abscessus]|nr:Uncharacterised protein [Mycobacteroides abscessus subsp. abscessus]